MVKIGYKTGIRSFAEPYLHTISTFSVIVLSIQVILRTLSNSNRKEKDQCVMCSLDEETWKGKCANLRNQFDYPRQYLRQGSSQQAQRRSKVPLQQARKGSLSLSLPKKFVHAPRLIMISFSRGSGQFL